MKQYSKKLFSLVVLCSTATVMLHADSDDNTNQVVPFIQFRSQGRDTARKLYGTTSYAVYQDMDDRYGTFNVTLQYDQSFRNKEIAQALFGASVRTVPSGTIPVTPVVTNSCNTSCKKSCDNDCDDVFLTISGMQSANRGAFDWMAENFYLPRDFKSVIAFSPKVQDVLVDFNLFFGLDRWCSGLYFRLYGPVVWNKTNLRAHETIINKGTPTVGFDPATGTATTIGGGYPNGYFDENAIPTTSLFNNALAYFGGCPFPTAVLGSVKTVQPLRFAKFSDCNLPRSTTTVTNNCNKKCNDECSGTSHHKTGFAELRGEFGWNYIQENYRFLVNIQAAAPTGTRPNAEFIFPAQVGNGKHWELGGGIGGSWMMWNSEDGEKSFNFIVEADITHLFRAKQQRTFDLKCKANSRYMLAEQLVTPNAAAALTTGTAVFAGPDVSSGVYAPVANFSTRNVKVSIGVQGDVVAMFNYTCRGFSWDLGYNFWGMSKSKISLNCDENDCDNDDCNPVVIPFPTNFALKGDASVIGFNTVVATGGVAAYGLGATESAATIFAGTNGTNFTTPITPANALANPNIDTPTAAIGAPGSFNPGPLFVFGTTTPIQTSTTPKFISIDDLDVEGAEQRGLSHKVFTHFSYTWRDHEKWVPYFGGGFSAEFGSHSNSDDDCNVTVPATCNPCSSSLSFALSKWAVEIKGGVSFH